MVVKYKITFLKFRIFSVGHNNDQDGCLASALWPATSWIQHPVIVGAIM